MPENTVAPGFPSRSAARTRACATGAPELSVTVPNMTDDGVWAVTTDATSMVNVKIAAMTRARRKAMHTLAAKGGRARLR